MPSEIPRRKGISITSHKSVSKPNPVLGYARPVILCSSSLRPPYAVGPDRIVRLAAEAGFDGLAVDHATPLDLVAPVATAGLRSGVPVALGTCPVAASLLPERKRLPHLVARDDPEERLAACKLARQGLELGGPLGIRRFVVELGPAALRTAEVGFRLGFARAEMEQGEPGTRQLRLALAERKQVAQQLYDAGRAALEALLPVAERNDIELVLPIAAGPWQVPSPRETLLLLEEFRGAPLGVAFCPARRAVLERLDLSGPKERWPLLAAATRVVLATDEVGLDSDLLLGTGELAVSPLEGVPADAALAVSGPPASTIREVVRARRRAARLLTPAQEEAESAQAKVSP